MSEANSKPVDDLLAELDAEFGKKARRPAKGEAPHKAINKAFHAANPQLDLASGKIDTADAGVYSREQHALWLAMSVADRRQLGMPAPRWLPEARVTWVVHQHCAVCQETTWYTGNEYIRFRRNHSLDFRLINGESVRLSPTVLRRIGDCDPELVALGPADGAILADELHEVHETVLRCPACFHLEKHCSDMWNALIEKPKQQELAGLDELLEGVENGATD